MNERKIIRARAPGVAQQLGNVYTAVPNLIIVKPTAGWAGMLF
jgi:hypothetical protein